MSVPLVSIVVKVRNPAWTHENDKEFYVQVEVIAEVLTVHLEKNKMRVRFTDPHTSKVEVGDMTADRFFEEFQITRRKQEVGA